MMLRSRSQVKNENMEQDESSARELTSSKSKSRQEQNQWVMLVPENILKSLEGHTTPENQPAIIKLRHPKSDDGCQFLVCPDTNSIHEILGFENSKGSWFINNSVQEDGRLLMSTIVDPLFLVLPYLKKSKKNMFMELDQIVTDSDYPQCNRLVEILDHQTTCQICDSKGEGDFRVYRYNEEKTLTWLKLKVERTAEYLSSSDVSVSSGQCSAYVRSSKPTAAPKEDCLKYAVGLVSDYLHSDLSKKLFESFGIKEETTKGKRQSEKETKRDEEPPPKKVKKLSGEPDEDYSKIFTKQAVKSAPKMTAAQKRLAKVDKTGMKSLTSFFKKK